MQIWEYSMAGLRQKQQCKGQRCVRMSGEVGVARDGDQGYVKC